MSIECVDKDGSTFGPYEGMTDLRLNVGCGKWTLDGFVNIDIAVSPLAKREPEILCDIRKIPLPDGCAKELMAIHVFEHVDKWDAEGTMAEWSRLLKRGGLMVLEMPDLMKACRNILEGREGKKPDQLGMWALYGEPVGPLMQHKWAWTFKTIKPLMERCGLTDLKEEQTQYHQSGRDVRDFRVTARKA